MSECHMDNAGPIGPPCVLGSLDALKLNRPLSLGMPIVKVITHEIGRSESSWVEGHAYQILLLVVPPVVVPL